MIVPIGKEMSLRHPTINAKNGKPMLRGKVNRYRQSWLKSAEYNEYKWYNRNNAHHEINNSPVFDLALVESEFKYDRHECANEERDQGIRMKRK